MQRLLLILAISLNACASLSPFFSENTKSNEDADMIINGRTVDKNSEWRYRAVLLHIQRDQQMHICTSVPVSKNLLLTAAHCVHGVSPKNINAIFAEDTHTNQKIQPYAVEQTVVHEQFNGTVQSYADVAFIKLKTAIPKNYRISPLYDGKATYFDDSLILIGYGITDEQNKDSQVLRMTTKSFKKDAKVKNELLAFNQKNSSGGFCKGDSGAPIFIKIGSSIKIIGINSFTASTTDSLDCHTASFAMYTPFFRNWLIEKMTQL